MGGSLLKDLGIEFPRGGRGGRGRACQPAGAHTHHAHGAFDLSTSSLSVSLWKMGFDAPRSQNHLKGSQGGCLTHPSTLGPQNLGVPSSASSPRLLSCLLSCSWHAGSTVVWGLVGEGRVSFSLMGRAAAPAPTVSRDPDSISSNHQHCHLPGVIKWYLNWIQKSHCKQPTWWGGRLWELELASKAAGSPEAAHVRPRAHVGTPGYPGGGVCGPEPTGRGQSQASAASPPDAARGLRSAS